MIEIASEALHPVTNPAGTEISETYEKLYLDPSAYARSRSRGMFNFGATLSRQYAMGYLRDLASDKTSTVGRVCGGFVWSRTIDHGGLPPLIQYYGAFKCHYSEDLRADWAAFSLLNARKRACADVLLEKGLMGSF
jgi:hypothetical protein